MTVAEHKMGVWLFRGITWPAAGLAKDGHLAAAVADFHGSDVVLDAISTPRISFFPQYLREV